jgi:hypothetical protein
MERVSSLESNSSFEEDGMVMKLLTLTTLAVAADVFFFGTTWAGGPWSLFGYAYSVREGLKPNSWAIALSSTCPDTSINCLADGALAYSGVNFNSPGGKLSFRRIYQLSTSYKITEWDCGGSSPRFAIGIDTDGDRKVNGHVFVYIGSPPSFTGCRIGVWEQTGNLIDSKDSDARFDIGQLVKQTPYLSYKDALAALGDLADQPVLYVMLVVDGGWQTDQLILVDNVRVNNFKLTAKEYGKKSMKPNSRQAAFRSGQSLRGLLPGSTPEGRPRVCSVVRESW